MLETIRRPDFDASPVVLPKSLFDAAQRAGYIQRRGSEFFFRGEPVVIGADRVAPPEARRLPFYLRAWMWLWW